MTKWYYFNGLACEKCLSLQQQYIIYLSLAGTVSKKYTGIHVSWATLHSATLTVLSASTLSNSTTWPNPLNWDKSTLSGFTILAFSGALRAFTEVYWETNWNALFLKDKVNKEFLIVTYHLSGTLSSYFGKGSLK